MCNRLLLFSLNTGISLDQTAWLLYDTIILLRIGACLVHYYKVPGGNLIVLLLFFHLQIYNVQTALLFKNKERNNSYGFPSGVIGWEILGGTAPTPIIKWAAPSVLLQGYLNLMSALKVCKYKCFLVKTFSLAYHILMANSFNVNVRFLMLDVKS